MSETGAEARDRPRVAIVTFSDRSYQREREDLTGPALREQVESYGWEVTGISVIPDEMELGKETLVKLADSGEADLILTNGGTGCAPRDIAPEATLAVIEREVPGIPEVMRAKSLAISANAMLSRSRAGIRGKTLIVNLPGSPKAAKECLDMVKTALPHAMELLTQKGPFNCAELSQEKK